MLMAALVRSKASIADASLEVAIASSGCAPQVAALLSTAKAYISQVLTSPARVPSSVAALASDCIAQAENLQRHSTIQTARRHVHDVVARFIACDEADASSNIARTLGRV